MIALGGMGDKNCYYYLWSAKLGTANRNYELHGHLFRKPIFKKKHTQNIEFIHFYCSQHQTVERGVHSVNWIVYMSLCVGRMCSKDSPKMEIGKQKRNHSTKNQYEDGFSIGVVQSIKHVSFSSLRFAWMEPKEVWAFFCCYGLESKSIYFI